MHLDLLKAKATVSYYVGCPGHDGIPGNWAADRGSKAAPDRALSQITMPNADFRSNILKYIRHIPFFSLFFKPIRISANLYPVTFVRCNLSFLSHAYTCAMSLLNCLTYLF